MNGGFWGYLANPDNKRKLTIIFIVILVIVFASDFLVNRHHAVFIWDKIPGWSAFYGFVSCVLLIIVAKFFGHAWLYKKEDYYDRD